MSRVTADSSQGAPSAPSAPSADGESSANNQQIRIAVLVILALVAGVVLWLILGRNDTKAKPKPQNLTKALGPWALSGNRLHAEALTLGQPMYWAGPKRGVRYEFWRTTNNRIFIRYLPKGVRAGAPGQKYLIIGTYPVSNAYRAVKKLDGSVKGPGRSVVWVRPNDPRSVLIAWPGVPYEVEVYDPRPANAATVAQSGQVSSVG
jgi:hypothetical protein